MRATVGPSLSLDLASEVNPVPLLPHVRLNGVPWDNGFSKPSLV